jgi:hypothetical protein
MRLNAHEKGLPSTLDYRLDIVGIRTDVWTQVSFSETGVAKIRMYAEQNPTYSSETISSDLFPELKGYYDTFQNSSYQIHRLTGREYGKPAGTKQVWMTDVMRVLSSERPLMKTSQTKSVPKATAVVGKPASRRLSPDDDPGAKEQNYNPMLGFGSFLWKPKV